MCESRKRVQFQSHKGKFIYYVKGGWRYWGGLWKFLDTRKGDSEKIRVWGALKICILQNQQEGGAPKKLNH